MEHTKDIHRYSYSRLETFKTCPRKHHYLYVEQIPEPENEYALSGKYLHRAIEAVLKGEELDELYKEFHNDVDSGKIRLDRDQLEYTVGLYFSYYYREYEKENTLLVEQEFTRKLEDQDYFVMVNDQTLESNGMVIVRDVKSTRGPLKYSHEDVLTNMQLLTYVPDIEKHLNRKVDAIQIDEVRMAKLATQVPLIQRGRPSTSLDALSLVTADLYREELERQGLLDESKYKNVLALLEKRGHPLFNRITIQLTNRAILDTNEEELQNLYLGASLDLKYRIKDRSRCFLCPFHGICEIDEFQGGEKSRENIIESIE